MGPHVAAAAPEPVELGLPEKSNARPGGSGKHVRGYRRLGMDVRRADIVVEPLVRRLKHELAGHRVDDDRRRTRSGRRGRRCLVHQRAPQVENLRCGDRACRQQSDRRHGDRKQRNSKVLFQKMLPVKEGKKPEIGPFRSRPSARLPTGDWPTGDCLKTTGKQTGTSEKRWQSFCRSHTGPTNKASGLSQSLCT